MIKKNWMQLISLALNVVLLICLVVLGGKIENLHAKTMSRLNTFNNDIELLWQEVSSLRESQREQTEFVDDYSFAPAGVDGENKTLTGEMRLTLRRWNEDTAVTLVTSINGETRELPMTGAAGVFTAQVDLPLEQGGELRFDAAVTHQGETTRESVCGYSDLSMLLPLLYRGGGWSGPEYQGGTLELMTYDAGLEMQYGAEVANPAFLVLKNGSVEQEVPAVFSALSEFGDENTVSYVPDTKDASLRMECEAGDTVEIHLTCQDSFGLTYDFFLQSWFVTESGTVEQVYPDTDCSVEVSWEK